MNGCDVWRDSDVRLLPGFRGLGRRRTVVPGNACKAQALGDGNERKSMMRDVTFRGRGRGCAGARGSLMRARKYNLREHWREHLGEHDRTTGGSQLLKSWTNIELPPEASRKQQDVRKAIHIIDHIASDYGVVCGGSPTFPPELAKFSTHVQSCQPPFCVWSEPVLTVCVLLMMPSRAECREAARPTKSIHNNLQEPSVPVGSSRDPTSLESHHTYM